MRKIEYLSPTSISTFAEDREKFYVQYLADNRPAREPQTNAMAVGSSFDAFVKSWLHEKLFGKGKDARFDLQTLFEAQVEEHNRDEAYTAGKMVFEHYQASGCLVDLMLELQNSVIEPRFEFSLMGIVNGYREGVTLNIGGVPLLGKPDVYYQNKQAASVIHDWKVNGYYSQWGASPVKHYVKLRDQGKDLGPHKEVYPVLYKGMKINTSSTMEHVKEDWARQLTIYAWLVGEEVGSDFILSIDQVVCRGGGFRFAEHRTKVGRNYQFELFARIEQIWSDIHSDHFFKNLTPEQSQAQCKILDSLNYEDDWIQSASRR